MVMITILSIYVAIYMASKTTTIYSKFKPAKETSNPLSIKKSDAQQPQNQNRILSPKEQAYKDQERNNHPHRFTKTLSKTSDKNTNKSNKNRILDHLKTIITPEGTSDEKTDNTFQSDTAKDQVKKPTDQNKSKPTNASSENNKLYNHREEYIKRLVSSLEASLSGSPKDVEIHIISTVNSSCPELDSHHNKWGNCNGPPLHKYKGNSQLAL